MKVGDKVKVVKSNIADQDGEYFVGIVGTVSCINNITNDEFKRNIGVYCNMVIGTCYFEECELEVIK